MRYDEILDAVASGAVDAGLIIHESRFTYAEHGLVRVVDLGEWWEAGDRDYPSRSPGSTRARVWPRWTRSEARNPRLGRVRLRASGGQPRVRARALARAVGGRLPSRHIDSVRERVQRRPRRAGARRDRAARVGLALACHDSLVWVLSAVRTPVGRYGGALSGVRPDDLAALVMRGRRARRHRPRIDRGCLLRRTNQAGEDNRNVARMAALLAGLPASVPGSTVNRLCASGLEAVNIAARMIEAGHGDVFIAGGVESMSRAPFVPARRKPRSPVAADLRHFDRLAPGQSSHGGAASPSPWARPPRMSPSARITRADQDQFALQSQQRWSAAHQGGLFAEEIVPVGSSVDAGRAPAAGHDAGESRQAETRIPHRTAR